MSINQLSALLTDTVLTSGLTALFSLIYLFQMNSFAPKLVIPGTIVLTAMLSFTILTGLVQRKISEKQMNLSAKINGLIFGLFNGIQKVKLAGAEQRAFAKWQVNTKRLQRLHIRHLYL